jgi:hypothetical protein
MPSARSSSVSPECRELERLLAHAESELAPLDGRARVEQRPQGLSRVAVSVVQTHRLPSLRRQSQRRTRSINVRRLVLSSIDIVGLSSSALAQ